MSKYFKVFIVILLSTGVLLVLSCSKKKTSRQLSVYPYYPDTDAIPSLTLHMDRPLDNSNVTWLGAFGVWEGAMGTEIASELEIHLDHGGENVYAMCEGVVVYLQPSTSSGDPNKIEGVWVRYGRRFMVKYVHVDYPSVKEGDIISRGQALGKIHYFGVGGFWETEVRVKQLNGRVFTDALIDYLDTDSRIIFEDLWADLSIGRTAGPPAPFSPWRAKASFDITDSDNPEFW